MEELKGLIEELLNHIDNHKEAYNKPEWTNKNIVNAWFRSYDHKFKNLGLFSVSKRSELLIKFLRWQYDDEGEFTEGDKAMVKTFLEELN